MLSKLAEVGKLRRFHDKCQDAIALTDPPLFCKICGEQKKEFMHPRSGRITPLDCQCEREYKHYKETYENYRQCDLNKDMRYFQLIDGHRHLASHHEKSIAETGQKLRETVGWYERKIRS